MTTAIRQYMQGALVVAFALGISLFSAAGTAHAGDVSCPPLNPGDMITPLNDSSVWIITEDGTKMEYPTSEVYQTWHEDFSGILGLEDACVDALVEDSVVLHRPGSRLVKLEGGDEIYAITPNRVLREVVYESVAIDLYGENWPSATWSVPSTTFYGYTFGEELFESVPHDGQLITHEYTNAVYYVHGGERHYVIGALPEFLQDDVRTVTLSVFTSLPYAKNMATVDDILRDPTQRLYLSYGAPETDIVVNGISFAPQNPKNHVIADGNDLVVTPDIDFDGLDEFPFYVTVEVYDPEMNLVDACGFQATGVNVSCGVDDFTGPGVYIFAIKVDTDDDVHETDELNTFAWRAVVGTSPMSR